MRPYVLPVSQTLLRLRVRFPWTSTASRASVKNRERWDPGSNSGIGEVAYRLTEIENFMKIAGEGRDLVGQLTRLPR